MMPEQESPESAVDAFVRNAPECVCTCDLGPKGDSVNRAIQRFHELKTSGETTQAWTDFHSYVLRPLSYPRSVKAMRDHTRKCLDLQS